VRATIIPVLVLLLTACGGDNSGKQTVNRDTLTERQKDSILAKSRIPGASGVGRAMTAADSTSAGARRADSVVAADTTER
jgi:outer membrane biogenesis lipoprotein LolB